MIGKTISHYKIVEKLGEGGMGEVYLAEDTELKRRVALKFLPEKVASDADTLERFKREAQAAAALNHPNIITVYEIDRHEDLSFIAMAYVDGELLSDELERGIPLERALDIVNQVCEGLDKAHQAGIVHRDVKPENLLIDRDGRVKILDFGLAVSGETGEPSSEESTYGTVYYMSPEQVRGDKVDVRSDVFSLGAVLYELLAGKRPFKGEHSEAIRYSVLHEEPEPLSTLNPRVSPELERVVAKALAKNPEDRYPSTAVLATDLKASSSQSAASPGGVFSKKLAIPGAAVLLAVVLLLVFNPFNWRVSTDKGAIAAEKTIAIMYFDNLAQQGDPGRLGEIITNLLITNLSQSEDLNVISSQRLYDILKLHGKEGAKIIDRTTATEIARKAGAGRMMLGSILQITPHLVITAQLVDVVTGNVEASQQVTGEPGGTVFDLVDRMTGETRTELAVPVQLDVGQPKPVSDVTTNSLDAYRHYVEGLEHARKFYYGEAYDSFGKALEYDSTFAMAHYRRAWSSFNMQNNSEGIVALEKAVQYLDRAGEKERLYIEATKAFTQRRDDEAFEKMTRVTEEHPDDKEAFWLLATFYYARGRFEPSLENYREVLALDPMHKTTYNQMAYLYNRVGNFEKSVWAINQYIELAPGEANPYDSRGDLYAFNGVVDSAMSSYRKATEIKPDFHDSLEKLGHMLLYKGQYEEAEAQYRKLVNNDHPAIRSRGRNYPAVIHIYRGRLREALAALDEAIAADVNEGFYGDHYWRKTTLRWSSHIGLKQYDIAAAQSERDFATISQIFPSLSAVFDLAFAGTLVASNMIARADSIIELYETELDTLDQMSLGVYHFSKGIIALKKDDPEAAVNYLEKADSVNHNDFDYTTRYWLATAYLQNDRADDAVTLLEGMLNRYDGNRLSQPILAARGHHLLGTAYQQVGANDKAVEQLQTFLEIWKDADPELEEVSDAKRRLEELGASG